MSTFDVPALDTDRLTLRGHARDDLGESAAMWGDPVVTRYIGGTPFTAEEVWARLLRYVGHWSVCGFGYWVVRERATGRFAGEVGFADYQRDLTPSFDGAPEAGWVLAPWSHGAGFATEAMRAVIAWGDRQLASRRTVCIIDPDNAASLAVARKLGYAEYARTTYKGAPAILFER